MNELPPEDRSLIAAARRSDRLAPAGPRRRMRRALVGALALSTGASAGSLTLGKLVLVALASGAAGSGATLAVSHLAARQNSRLAPTARAESETPDAPSPVSGRATAAPGTPVPTFSPTPLATLTTPIPASSIATGAPPVPALSLATPAPGSAPTSPRVPPRSSARAEEQLPVTSASPMDPSAPPPDGLLRPGGRPRHDTWSPRTTPSPLESLSLPDALASTVPASPSRPRADELETPDIPPPATTPTARHSEAAELARAYAAVAERRWAEARSALDGYRLRFPSGKLALEADVLEVLVRCGEGHGALARQLAERLEAKAPANPAVQRLGAFCLTRGTE